MYLTLGLLIIATLTLLFWRRYGSDLEESEYPIVSARSTVFLTGLFLMALVAVNPEHLLNQTAPSEGDARAHIGRIIMFEPFTADAFYWSTSWYEGFPFAAFYPPLFYALGAGISEILTELVTYKILRVATLFGLLSSIYYLARSCDVDRGAAFITSVAAFIAPIIPYTMYRGAFPFLLGVLFSFFTLGAILRHGPKLRVFGLMGLALLAHPYSAFILAVPGIAWLVVYRNSWNIRDILVGGLVAGGVAGVHYFPFIYRYLQDYSTAPLIEDVFLSNIAVFAISLPLAGVFIMFFYRYKPANAKSSIIMFSGGLGAALVALLPNFDGSIPKMILGWRFLLPSWLLLAIAIISLFAIVDKKIKSRHVAATFVVLFLSMAVLFPMTGLVQPSDVTQGQHYQNYYNERPEGLDRFNEEVGDDRVISRARLGDVYGPVTFAPKESYNTVTGPYNQGDPFFFRTHVYVEWQSKYLEYETTRDNLLELTGADSYTTNSVLQRTSISANESDSSTNSTTIYQGNLTGSLDAQTSANEYEVYPTEVTGSATIDPTDQLVIQLQHERLENAWVSVDVQDQNGIWWRYRADSAGEVVRGENRTVSTLFAGYRAHIDGETVGPREPITPQKVRIIVDDLPDSASGTSTVTLKSIETQTPAANLTVLGDGWVLVESETDHPRTVSGDPVLVDTETIPERVVTNHLNVLPASGPEYIFVGPESGYPVNETQGIVTDSQETLEEYEAETDGEKSAILLQSSDQFDTSVNSSTRATIQTGDFFEVLPTAEGVPSVYFEDQEEPYTEANQSRARAVDTVLQQTLDTGGESPSSYQASRSSIKVENLTEDSVLLRQSHSPFWSGSDVTTYPSMSGQIIVRSEGTSDVRLQYSEPTTIVQSGSLILACLGVLLYWHWKTPEIESIDRLKRYVR